MKVSPVHLALRAATARRHESLEIDADLEARLRDPTRRGAALRGLFDFHVQAEAAARPLAAPLFAADVMPAERSAALAGGLSELGLQPPPQTDPAPPADVSAALGWLYVAEGSALGGRVMLKAMIRDGIDLTGLGFLDPHGEETGPRWMRFLAVLDAAVSEGRADADAVVQAAIEAFDRARVALVSDPAVSRAA